MIEAQNYRSVRRDIMEWPSQAQFVLLEELLQRFRPRSIYTRQVKKDVAIQDGSFKMIGLLETEQQLSNEDIEQILYEEKLKQHGLAEYL